VTNGGRAATVNVGHGADVPRAGMLAIIRKRRGIISEVREFDGETGRLHLVRVDYKDDLRPPFEEVIWELEPSSLLLQPSELPRASDPPMRLEDFDALPPDCLNISVSLARGRNLRRFHSRIAFINASAGSA